MSRVHVHIGRVVAHGEVSPTELTGALQSELRGLLQAEPPAARADAHTPSLRVAPAGAPSSSALGRIAARAIHGGLKS